MAALCPDQQQITKCRNGDASAGAVTAVTSIRAEFYLPTRLSRSCRDSAEVWKRRWQSRSSLKWLQVGRKSRLEWHETDSEMRSCCDVWRFFDLAKHFHELTVDDEDGTHRHPCQSGHAVFTQRMGVVKFADSTCWPPPIWHLALLQLIHLTMEEKNEPTQQPSYVPLKSCENMSISPLLYCLMWSVSVIVSPEEWTQFPSSAGDLPPWWRHWDL